MPTCINSHVRPDNLDRTAGEMALLPNFRMPTLIHTRSGNAKWLNEISHSNPLWLHPADARASASTPAIWLASRPNSAFRQQSLGDRGLRPGVVAARTTWAAGV